MSETTQKPDMTPGLISWSELATNDQAGSSSFYGQLFGWTVQDMPTPSPEVKYACFMQGERPVGGLLQMPAAAQGAPTQWIPYITVANAREATEKAVSLGAKLLKEVTVLPMGTFSVIADPQGATLGLWEFSGDCGEGC